MDGISELRIEYQRLKHHVDHLMGDFDDATARDLSACLRNWVQMEKAIDDLAASKGWQLAFRYQEKPKELKKLRSKGEYLVVPLPGTARSTGVMVTGVVLHNRALTPEEIKMSYERGKSSLPRNQVMTFGAFLNGEGAEFRRDGVLRTVARRDFIDRCANRLGGTHPMSVAGAEEKEHWSDPFILELNQIRVGPWPTAYAVLMEAGEQILDAFEPVVQDEREP